MVKTTQKPIRGVFNLQPYEIDYSLSAMTNFKNLPEKFPAEVIDNHLYVHDPATIYHARINHLISCKLTNYVRAKRIGEVFVEPAGVFFDQRKTAVTPDIFFIRTEKTRLLQRKGLLGSPDLCIEILSPSTRNYNFKTKKDLYEKYGVKEYWLVDPETKDTHGFLLENGKYGEPLILNGKINIRILNKSIKF